MTAGFFKGALIISVSCLAAALLNSKACFGYTVFENENLCISSDVYFRTDLVTFKNVVDLDSKNKDDSTVYLGIDYSIGLLTNIKNHDAKFFLRLERNGPFDYDAPLFVHNTLMTSSGVVEAYRNDELLPQLEEFWLDTPLPKDLKFKIGLYTYEVGNGFSLNGSYENYGFTIYRELENATWRLYYCRPDVVYKNDLGPRIRQDQEQEIQYNHNASNFFATDFNFRLGKDLINPYIGVLADYTSPGKRDNLFSAPVKKDILGTVGFSWNGEKNNFTYSLELAHNFGQAESSDPDFKDIYHTGYLFFTDLGYRLKKITPSFQFLLCSGNKVTPDMAENEDTTLTSGKNRAFSYFSPFDLNLSDSISAVNADARPIVAMGSGYGLNYGVPRPRTFYSSDYDNLIMPSLGFDFKPIEKLDIDLRGYYLLSFERGVGTLNGVGKYLSRELGSEIDLLVEYSINEHMIINLLGGVFLPGRFYKEERDDASGSLFAPFLRGDGKANKAYQVELALEFNF